MRETAPLSAIGQQSRAAVTHRNPNSPPHRAPPMRFELPDAAKNGVPRWVVRATWIFLLLGIAARLVRYFAHFPLWNDEILLLGNFLDRGYADMLRPLNQHQVAPVSFLWIELLATQLFGFSEWPLRLFPLICGIATLVLFRRLLVRNFDALTALWALAIFATTHYAVRYNGEIKPYAGDALSATVLLYLALGWQRSAGSIRWLWALAAVAPLAIFLSYPAVFVIGGLSAALFPSIWRTRSAWAWCAYILMNVLSALSFLVVVRLAAGSQFSAEEQVMREYWGSAFPPLANIRGLFIWLLDTHTGELFAYPFGSEKGGGAIQFLLFATGLAAVSRGPQRMIVGATLGMIILALTAAALQLYPYGGHPRLMQYLSPFICLFMAAGITALLKSMRHAAVRQVSIVVAMMVFGCSGLAMIARDIVKPYRDRHEKIYRDSARWFWRLQNAYPGQVASVDTDWHHDFYNQHGELSWLAFRCNQRIYSNRHRPGISKVDFKRVTSEWPLRCIIYHQAGAVRDDARFNDWLADMKERFVLKNSARYTWQETADKAREVYEVYEFVPKSSTAMNTAVPARRQSLSNPY